MTDPKKSTARNNTFIDVVKTARSKSNFTIAVCAIVCSLFFILAFSAVTDRNQGAYVIGPGFAQHVAYSNFNSLPEREVEMRQYLTDYTNAMYGFDATNYTGQMKRALELGGTGGPAEVQLDWYKKNNYFDFIVSSGTKLSVKVDSVQTDMSSEPYKANVFATQTTFNGSGSEQYRLWYYVEVSNLNRRVTENVYAMNIKVLTPFDQTKITSR
ncbi:MAG: hypothetical protein IM613_06900 [Cytophagales bacterium]|nr:hypothetical protein [Cytophagales bacterium]